MALDGSEAEAGRTDFGNTSESLNKNCKRCDIELTTDNAAKVYAKGEETYRSLCKKCRNKQVSTSYAGNKKRQKYIRNYIRRIGIVKEYPCESCGKMCYKHYGRIFCSDMCRFMAYIDKQESCWIWTGTKNRTGYGKLCFKDNKSAIASRVSYELFKGPIEDGMFICHTCDVRSCVNPDHLWAGSHMENTIDMIDKGRQHSKLNPSQVFKIRKMWHDGCSQAMIKEKFNITSGAISNIIARRIWKHV